MTIVLAPLVAAIVAGLFGSQIGRAGAHWVTIVGVAISFVLSLVVLKSIVFDGAPIFNGTVYTMGRAGRIAHGGRLPRRPPDGRHDDAW